MPEGYFADFRSRMMETVGQQTAPEPLAEQSAAARRPLWHILRPYTYMAAMFAGIWLMMKIFVFVGPKDSPELSYDDFIASNNDHESYVYDYISDSGSLSEYDLYDDLYDDGYDPEDY